MQCLVNEAAVGRHALVLPFPADCMAKQALSGA